MNKIKILFIIICLLLSSDNVLAKSKDNVKYLLIGDSYGYMLGKELKKLSKKEDIVLKTNARGGTNSSQWIDNKWFEKTIDKYHPIIVMVSLGVNDAGVPANKKRFKDNAIKIVKIAEDRGIKVLWILPPKVYYNINYIDKGLKEAKPFYIFDTKKLNLSLEKDRVHPTYWSNRKWAKEIWKELKECN